MENYAPAAVLINRKYECLYSIGPIDPYLRVAPGHPTHDLLSMAHKDIRNKLRSALQQASQQNARIVVPGGRITHNGEATSFSIDVRPTQSDGEELLLVCFVGNQQREQRSGSPVNVADVSRVAELEQELKATRAELQGAIRDLETSGEEQKAINEEALSVNEEYQSTNEELLTSKEELQSLNEELTASSHPPQRHSSMSFPATSAGRWRTCHRWLWTARC
jgi:two-component system CheB/CheR fusion protein